MNPKDHAQDEIMLAPQAVSANATVTANLDINGRASYATIRVLLASEVNVSAVGPTISVLESDDTVVTNFATIVADQVVQAVGDKQAIYHIDLRGRKRYLRLSVTSATATNDGNTVSAGATLSHMRLGPSSTSDMVASTEDVVTVV